MDTRSRMMRARYGVKERGRRSVRAKVPMYVIGRQLIHVHLGMPDQRHGLLDRLGPDKAVALWGAMLIGGDGKGEDGHGVKMGEAWLMGA